MTTSDDGNWYYTDGSSTFGPFQLAVLQQLVSAGVLGSQTLVCQAGSDRWLPTSQIISSPSHASILPPVPAADVGPGIGHKTSSIKPQNAGSQAGGGALANIGFGLVLLGLVAGAITFWSGRPELLAIVLVAGLFKHLLFSKPKRRR